MAALQRHLSENNKLIFPSPPLLRSKKNSSDRCGLSEGRSRFGHLSRDVPPFSPTAGKFAVRRSVRATDKASSSARDHRYDHRARARARAAKLNGGTAAAAPLPGRASTPTSSGGRRQSLQWGRAGDRDGGKGQCCRMAVRPAKLSRPPVLRDKQPFTLWTLD